MPHKGKKKGDVLLSYLTEPFTIPPAKGFSNYHTMYWECYEIARLFAERGYDVDIKEAKNTSFIPKKRYAVCVDAEEDLERLSKYLPKDCKKVFHILIPYWKAYNEAEEARLQSVEKRRGVRLLPRRKMNPSNDAKFADFLEGFGNRTIFGTFKEFNKPITLIPISAMVTYDFPETKDFDEAKKNFLWIGGGGTVLKGLDIALEAFSKTPELKLHVCGPIHGEEDFAKEYHKELYETPNIRLYGRLDVASDAFRKIIATCAALVYPSGGEGTSGAVIQAMHAGLVPLITHYTGVQEDSGYIALENPTPESVARAVRDFSGMSAADIKEKARGIWKYANARYTHEEFSRAYAKFIDEKLKI